MKRLISAILSAAILAVAAADTALAQADAQDAYQRATASYQASEFAAARDLALRASQTDPKNAEVFLLLGKAHYQLGEIDKAIAAWKQTLALAPEEPFAAQMLAVLRVEKVETDARIKLVEVMIQEKLLLEALHESQRLLAEKAISESERAKVLLLQAEITLKLNQPAVTLAKLQQVRILYPRQADPVQAMLLEGQAELRSGGESTVEGMARLRKLVADHPGTAAAATARYALIGYELQQGVNPARARALAKWLADSPDHPQVGEALKALIEAYLSVTRQGEKPTPEAELTKWDVDALALADELYKQTPNAEEAKQLTELLLKHLDDHYAKHGAYAAAVKGAELQQGVPLPRNSRLLILKALVRYKTAIAVKYLDDQTRVGKLPPVAELGDPPEVLDGVLVLYAAINSEYPAEPPWVDQAQLAAKVRTYAARVRFPQVVSRLKGPDAWAIDIARTVVKADGDAAAVQTAVELFQGIVKDYSALQGTDARRLTVSLSRLLVDEPLAPTHAAWSGVMAAHAELIDRYAKFLFDENLKSGNAENNADLSDSQKELLQVLTEHVTRESQRAPGALKLLGEHIKPWIAHDHWALAEEMYQSLSKALPAPEQREAELAVVGLWVQRVTRKHARLAAAGLTVPRELDPTLAAALARLYQLQTGLGPQSAELQGVRGHWDRIVAHYKSLEYYEIAEAAIQVKADAAVEAADEYAAFQLVQLKDEHARRELSRFLEQYSASERIVLTPEFQAAISGWKQFIVDRPASPLAVQAVEKVFAVGQLFEQHEARSLATEVYEDIEKFSAGIKVLSQPKPGELNTPQRASFAVAGALDALARKALTKAMADRSSDDPLPGELSEEFTAAIAAYYGFIKTYPDNPAVNGAIGKIMAIAHEYAKVDAWDVADGVYAGLLESELEIRRPERLKFARGLCRLGHVMPDHAREILAALTGEGLRGSGDPAGPEMLAMLNSIAVDELSVGGRDADAPDSRPGDAGGQVAGGSGAVSGTASEAAARRPSPTTPHHDTQLLAMIRRQESNRAAQVARLRERIVVNAPVQQFSIVNQTDQQEMQVQQIAQQGEQQPTQQTIAVPVLSEAELLRQEKALTAAYEVFQAIRKEHPHTPTALHARAEILVMVGHWRTLGEWERSAVLAVQFLEDNSTDRELPKLRLEIARDRLAWASKPIPGQVNRRERLDEVSKRFDAARAELAKIVADFPRQRSYQQDAQWDIADSFLKQARVIGAFSPTLARGQFVRTAKELTQVAQKYPKHPEIGTIPQMLWNVSAELEGRAFDEEAILVWNDLMLYDPMHALSQQAALKIAQTYQQKLGRPLKAAEAYQELHFARGGSDQSLQDAIFQIGSELKGQKRWVEALHILETFVDSFPQHAQAGQALAMVGQIHQANEAWEDAIAAYRRVIDEFENGQFVQDAKWAIAECTINLSRWREASTAYREYLKAYPKDEKLPEANRRIEVLKDLVRYQGLVDEEGQRKAFDAQYQIAAIVKTQLSNPVKAIIEYRKVVENWPASHLADDALYAVGTTYLSLGETDKAREALLAVGAKYAASPLADDALFMVGKSYEDEATKLSAVTRETTLERNKDLAQRRAYQMSQDNRLRQQQFKTDRIAGLRKAGKAKEASVEEAGRAANYGQFYSANTALFAQKAFQEIETLTATELADRQDKMNAALRRAVEAYTKASEVAGADKADDALLQMATIFDQRLKDSQAAMQTWLEIVRQFSGTEVAEDASWRIAQYYERENKYAEAIEAYNAFLRNYPRSPQAGPAQFDIAESHEHLGQWISAMDSYTKYITNFAEGPLVAKAKEQINWIKTYRL